MPRPSQCGFNLKLTIWRVKQRSQATNSTNQVKREIISEIDIQKNNYNENYKEKGLNDTVYED